MLAVISAVYKSFSRGWRSRKVNGLAPATHPPPKVWIFCKAPSGSPDRNDENDNQPGVLYRSKTK
jgi:hypothetical protein